ncbi:MAG: glycosyltransferase family 4 protein [Lachnospiraceae bacterium]|nr:glycosyltransferase family 4 protein [Lachnospiraceae bacterium]
MNDNKKYRILLVHNFYQQPGGEDTVFRNEKKLLEDKGHEVITYTRDNSELKGNFLKKILLPFITIFNPKTYFDIKKIIKDKNIDIVHVHNTLCFISPAVFYAAIKMKSPVIQTLHNFRMQCSNGLFYRDGHICEDCVNYGLLCALKHKCYRNSFFQTLAIVLLLKIHRFIGIYRKVNFICLTEFNKSKLLLNKKHIVDEDKVFVKPNFVFEENTNYNSTNKLSEKDYNSINKGYYLFVGRLDEIKGIDIVLEAFSKLQDRELHVIGSGSVDYIKEYSKYGNIKFLGQLPHNEVMNEMKNGKALIFPSKLFEGNPMTIIESYENRLPVVSSDVGNAKEMVEDGINGLHFKTGDAESLISTIEKLDKIDMITLKENAYREFDNKYNQKVGYNNIINLYSRMIEKD